ncbi:MAG: glutaredoxin domain-containing protein [Halobacteriota archaeon]|nr:glutaredoxin domain-containing protein [Halobacteriota archaeon]
MEAILYTTPICPWCYVEKRFLKKNKIEFEEIDVSKDMEAAKKMIDKSGRNAVPQTEINGKIIVGYNKEALKKEFGL